jgi:hypothetical protein
MADQDGSAAQKEAFAASRADRDRTLQSMHRLEAALGRAADGEGWLDDVMISLGMLQRAMEEEQHELERPDALPAMIAAERPRRYGSRIRNLREQYDDIARQVSSLLDQLDHAEESEVDAGDLRNRSSWIIRALQDCRARQTDLVFEALAVDLGDVDATT